MKNLFVILGTLIAAQSTFAITPKECKTSLNRLIGYFDVVNNVAYTGSDRKIHYAITVRYTGIGAKSGKTGCVLVNSVCSEAVEYAANNVNACTLIQQQMNHRLAN